MKEKRNNPISLARHHFFDNQVHQENWKKSMSGKNEERVIKVLDSLGFKLDEDYVRQYPIGVKFVMDFAFIKERICVEVDGQNHRGQKQKKIDKIRDRFMYDNSWVVIRIDDKDFFDTYKMSIYKNLIKEVYKERNNQYKKGDLYYIDVDIFKIEDYD